MTKRAFISVYDKEGVCDFVKNLVDEQGYEIVASGETYEYLKNQKIKVKNLIELFTSIDLTSSYNINIDDLETNIMNYFDLVAVNKVPYNELSKKTSNIDEMFDKIDLIDLGILKVAAKNYKKVVTIVDNEDYKSALETHEFERLKLAVKAFNYIAFYENCVSSSLVEQLGEKDFKILSFEKIKDLKYGENPHQKSAIYKTDRMIDYEVLHGSELSYNNILNITEAANIISEFFDVNAVAIIRHGKPCGVALGQTIYEAYTKAFDCDPVSSYYGTIGFSKAVDEGAAKHINSMSVEVIVAPSYTKEALKIFKENKDIKLVQLNTSLREYREIARKDLVVTPFGTLVQDSNASELNKDLFKVVTKQKPTKEQIEDAIFAWKVVKYAKTDAAVIAKDFKTSAISQGQTNSIIAVEQALNYSCDASKEAILAIDSTITAVDCIYSAVQGRISLIIQPGGSLKDAKLIETCDKYGISMITTGISNCRR